MSLTAFLKKIKNNESVSFDELLFGDFYHQDVMENLADSNHQNIRNFMHYGREGISFFQPALKAK